MSRDDPVRTNAGHRVAALVGNPNAGKSALFNALTGARQKIANYPGVTVERKAGRLSLPPRGDGSPETLELIDLPGSYSFDAASPDEEVTRKVVHGDFPGEAQPEVLVLVLDAVNLEQHLVFAQEVLELGRPTVVALNMVDLAERDGLTLDPEALSQALGVPVIPTVAVRRKGLAELLDAIADAEAIAEEDAPRAHLTLPERRLAAKHMARGAILSRSTRHLMENGADRILLNPWIGPVILFALLFVIFQAVFAWATPFADALEGGVGILSDGVIATLPEGFLRDAITEGVLAGVGSVVVFLPQIVILFFFILLMEATGYMARAAFLMDRLMAGVGLSGKSFIPLLSSFACAIPGIMATRSISDPKDRLTTILIAPLMTCSARLPVYAVIIAAFIPATSVGPGIGLQGLVLFALYVAGIVGAMIVALVLRRTLAKGGASGFIMEMPRYQMPALKDLAIGLWQRAWVFLRRAGTIIFMATIALWLLLSFPQAEPGESQLDASFAGTIADGLHPVLEPIGFNREISLALIPALAAREVAVSALATTYAVDAEDEDVAAQGVTGRIAAQWSLPTALAFLAWFVFAPQCLSTIAVTRRETNSWRWPVFMTVYLFALAYVFAGLTYWSAVALGL
ncbi:MAG: ferrous iron transporter B [Erythrobacter sp.]|nr:ferrous iron transporter B [Erythrobacter sp.]